MEKLLLVKKKIVNYATTNVLFLSFVLTSLLNGMLVRHFSVGGIFSYSPIMADLVFILVVGSFGYFITPKHQFKYYMAMSIFLNIELPLVRKPQKIVFEANISVKDGKINYKNTN